MTSILAKENSVKPNIKADGSGFFKLKFEIAMDLERNQYFCEIKITKLYKIVRIVVFKQKKTIE